MAARHPRREAPVLALDVENESRVRPAQERRQNQADALTRSGRSETKNVLGPVVAKRLGAEHRWPAADDGARGAQQIGGDHVGPGCPMSRAMEVFLVPLPIDVAGPDTIGAHEQKAGQGEESAHGGEEGPQDECRELAVRLRVVQQPLPIGGFERVEAPYGLPDQACGEEDGGQQREQQKADHGFLPLEIASAAGISQAAGGSVP